MSDRSWLSGRGAGRAKGADAEADASASDEEDEEGGDAAEPKSERSLMVVLELRRRTAKEVHDSTKSVRDATRAKRMLSKRGMRHGTATRR